MIREYKIKYFGEWSKEEAILIKAFSAEDAIVQFKNDMSIWSERIIGIEPHIKPETYGAGADIGG